MTRQRKFYKQPLGRNKVSEMEGLENSYVVSRYMFALFKTVVIQEAS